MMMIVRLTDCLVSVVVCRLPGDYGFDPLGLGEEPADLKWYVQAELVHCRFAMAGVAGILGTDVSCSSVLLSNPCQMWPLVSFGKP